MLTYHSVFPVTILQRSSLNFFLLRLFFRFQTWLLTMRQHFTFLLNFFFLSRRNIQFPLNANTFLSLPFIFSLFHLFWPSFDTTKSTSGKQNCLYISFDRCTGEPVQFTIDNEAKRSFSPRHPGVLISMPPHRSAFRIFLFIDSEDRRRFYEGTPPPRRLGLLWCAPRLQYGGGAWQPPRPA